MRFGGNAALLALCAEELRCRFPQLEAAIAAFDAPAIRRDAHALRGVAANFGLQGLAEGLLAVEVAARAGDPAALHQAMAPLPAAVAAALAEIGATAD